MSKGYLITFEGTEGAGKSTQIKLLEQYLKEKGKVVSLYREPGGTPIGEEVRHTLKSSHNNSAMDPITELLLMNASRAQLVREKIRPSLNKGEIVLLDRFYDSTIAYQGFGRQLPLDKVKSIIDVAVGDTIPDLTLLLRVSLKDSENNRLKRLENMPFIKDRFEEEDRAFFQRVYEGFEYILANEPNRVKAVDFVYGEENMFKSILRYINPLLGYNSNP